MKTLPPAALGDLRRAFTALEVTLGVPGPGPVVPKQLVRFPELAGELDHADTLMEVARDKEKDGAETWGR
eukprot:1629871-Lingulodinium_polyedra.AAC.1